MTDVERQPRRFRAPYEWILGAMFVGTFYVSAWMDSWIVRGAWLVIVMPIACISFRVKRSQEEPSPVFGVLAAAAAVGWLYAVTVFVFIEYKYEIGRETVDTVLEFTRWTWPIPPVLSLGSLILAAVRHGRYRELGVFANAALLLVFAWAFDRFLSPVS